MAEIDISVLGPVEVRIDGNLMNPGGKRQRGLLAMLVTERDSVVSLDRIVDLLWTGEPPDQAVATLQTYIANLRRALEPDRPPRAPATVLMTQPPGYRLRVDALEVDAGRFEVGVASARDLIDRDPTRAYELLTEALAFWRGPAYAEFADEVFAIGEAARLDGLRLLASETRYDAMVRIGLHTAVASELERFTVAHPLRERGHALLALALYRSGRQGEALRALDVARRHLGDELGLDPGRELQELEQAILRHDPSIDLAPATRSSPTLTGPETAAPPTTQPGAARPAQPPTHRGLPLVGRDDEVELLRSMLAEAEHGNGQAVLILGEPGAGKSALAEHIAELTRDRGGFVVWARCQPGVSFPFGVLQALIGSILEQLPATATEELQETRDELVRELTTMVAEERALPGSMSPSQQRVMALLGRLMLTRDDGPGTTYSVIIDDAQWADAPSLIGLSASWIPAVLANKPNPGFIILTVRSTEQELNAPLIDSLDRLDRLGVPRLVIGPLSQAAVAELVDGDEALAASVHVRTAGNAFFTTELLRLAKSEHALDVASLEAAVPSGVAEVIRRRLIRLPPDTQQLLSMAAVAGTVFDLTILSDVLAIDLDRAIDLVEPALLSGLVIDDPNVFGALRFSHGIVADAIVAEIPALRQASWHGRIADALIARHGGPREHLAAVTQHYVKAVPAGRGLDAIRLLQASSLEAGIKHFMVEAHGFLDTAETIVRSVGSGRERTVAEIEMLLCRAQIHAWAGNWLDPIVTDSLERVTTISADEGFDEYHWCSLWMRAMYAASGQDRLSARRARDLLASFIEERRESPDAAKGRALLLDVQAQIALQEGRASEALALLAQFPTGKSWRHDASTSTGRFVYKAAERRVPGVRAIAALWRGDLEPTRAYIAATVDLLERRHSGGAGMLGTAILLAVISRDRSLLTSLLRFKHVTSEVLRGTEFVDLARSLLAASSDSATEADLDALRLAVRSTRFQAMGVIAEVFVPTAAELLIGFGHADEALDLLMSAQHLSAPWDAESLRVCALALASLGRAGDAAAKAEEAVAVTSTYDCPEFAGRARKTLAELRP